MTQQTPKQREVAELIVEVLNLEDVAAESIDPEEPLFGEGLGLDSIDALEIAVAIAKTYEVHLKAEDEGTRSVFATLASLTTHIESESPALSA